MNPIGLTAPRCDAAALQHAERSLNAWRARLEAALQQCLGRPASPSLPLQQATEYALLGGGKRLRALLVYAAGHAYGASLPALDAAACAVEAIHAYSLVHDDLPCMDNDAWRRGQPSCHVQHGQAMALLAGDALQALAFSWLAGNAARPVEAGSALLAEVSAEVPPAVRLAQVETLARACGPSGMVAGQAIDLAHVGLPMSWPQLQTMHARKTGDLIAAAVHLGALVGLGVEGAASLPLQTYAQALGLAYQIVDDILDVEASFVDLGKTAGKDQAADKPTAVALLGLAPAKACVQRLHQEALDALAGLSPERQAPLVALANRMTQRSG